MKKTDLAKNQAHKLVGQMRQAGAPERFAGAVAPDRREQRRLDQAQGLVAFAVKLPQDLVNQLRGQAEAEGVGLNELTARLIQAGLAAKT
jgi:hypothetical protein